MVSAPFLIALMGPREGVKTSIALSILLNVLVLAKHHKGTELKKAATIAVPAVIATPIVAVAIRSLDADRLSIVAGVSIIVAVVALLTGVRLGWLRGPVGALATGVTMSVMNVTSGVFSPPAAIYAVNAGWSRSSLVPTFQVCFLALNIAAVASLGWPGFGPSLPIAVLVGWIAGTVLGSKMDRERLAKAVLIIAAAGGAAAIWKGFT